MKTILYITFSKRSPLDYYMDASVIYRCFQPCEFWRSIGHKSYVTHYMDALEQNVPADIVVFHRPRWCNEFVQLLAHYKTKRCVADYDDCLFDASILDTHPAYLSGATSLVSLKKLTKEYLQAAKCFELFFVSTDGIKDSAQSLFLNSEIFVVRNGISPYWRNLAGYAAPPQHKKIISYFSGTANHSADLKAHFESIDAAVSHIDDVEVHVYGQLKLNSKLPENWYQKQPVLFQSLPQLISQSHLCIAPMMDTPFNRCKSAIKFLESATFGKPLITQALPEFQRLSNPGLIFVEADWQPVIHRLLDKSHYRKAAEAAELTSRQHLVSSEMQEIAAWI